MNSKAIELLADLKFELKKNDYPSQKPIVKFGVSDGLIQQIHIKANQKGFEQLLLEQIDLLEQIQESKTDNWHEELAEEYADKICTIDIRTDIDKPLHWELEKPENFLEKMSYWGYSAIILFVLFCTLVGIKNIFEFLFLNN